MDKFVKILSDINIPTNVLSSSIIQEVLMAARKHNQSLNDSRHFWNEVTRSLWNHLQNGLNEFEDQLLCATCFYTAIGLSDKQDDYVKKISEELRKQINQRQKSLKSNDTTLQAVSLMYGLFQSPFITQNTTEKKEIAVLLQITFNLLMLIAYEYSKYTFVVFKTIHSFKKVYATDLQNIFFSKQNNTKLLNVVNHNWENPITGVRDLNKGIFQILLNVMDDEMYKEVLKELNLFYWNKAKYLMLAEIISQCNTDLESFIECDWINGLVSSLYKPGLVSAGADMYFSLLKKINSKEQWCKLFLNPTVVLLNGESQKGIENFSNYWCLTTFKSYPDLAENILNELEQNNQENKLYSSLCILKQANRLGLIDKNWDRTANRYERTILEGLEHKNNQIRLMAFEILCISNSKSLPEKSEYELVLNYLNNNVNSDCTVLRISMLKNFSSFLIQIHMSYLNYAKNYEEKEHLKYFCGKFQDFIIHNIKIGGNYQRKITCIKLLHTYLNGLKEVPRKRVKQIRKSNKSLNQMLEDEGRWLMNDEIIIKSLLKHLMDPAQDIRHTVGLLLLEHYSTQVRKNEIINLLIEDGLKSMTSKYFYEISCGQSMFKLIVNILICGEIKEAKFKSIIDIFNYALEELIKEYRLQKGIIESITEGKQLHSFMSILQVVLEVCYERKNIICIPKETLNTLLEVLQGISNQFSWDKETSTSSDFAKMSEMVNDIIVKSGVDTNNEKDSKISGLHQIVLNCLWLNIKTTCELSSLLIKYVKDETQIDICDKSLNIICHVLETCRHKGAIEAAGTALGQTIQYLSSLPENNQLSKLPLFFLKSKLNDLISEAAQMASVTRRGAGLSIMVHRVVSNDAKRGKPLFHYFMKTILDICGKVDDIPNTSLIQDTDSEKDLPKAIYIHFLTKIVTDSSLASDMMFYSVELVELAFGNLASPYWQIRNAALQLYGALVQKLIGQKKASGDDEESSATVACDELRTHSSRLWIYILNQLQNKKYEDKLQYHSNLVPILNMLANIARRYCFSSDASDQEKNEENMLKNFMLLLASPIFTVRRLTANCIINIFDLDTIFEVLLNQECLTENYIHGSLLLIQNLCKFCTKDIHKKKIDKLKKEYGDILKTRSHSYSCKEIFDNIFFDDEVTINDVINTLEELRRNSKIPGIFLWSNKKLQKYIHNASWDIVPELVMIILPQNESETYLSIFLEKIESEKNICQNILIQIANILLLSKNKSNSFITWKVLYVILLKINEPKLDILNTTEIINNLKETEITHKLRYMIPFGARLSAIAVTQTQLTMISETIAKWTDPETTDIEMRYTAVIANNELASQILNLPEAVRITAVKSAITLLQDEDEDIRMLSAKFYPLATKSKKALQPYICLCNILNHTFLDTILSKPGICKLIKDLTIYLTKVTSKNIDDYNPFANDLSNIYLEVNVLRLLIENL